MLLSGGPLEITITEVDTGQSVTIVDNGSSDSDSTLGSVQYSTPASSPFTDFSVTGLTATSNRLDDQAAATLTQLGTITRTTDTAGARTLQISVTDTGFLYPTNPTVLNSASNVTFVNPTALDSSQFQSFADSTGSPVITFTPSFTNPDVHSQSAAPTPLSNLAPFNLTDVYTMQVGPSADPDSQDSVSFQDVGMTSVQGTSNPAALSGTVFSDLNHNLTQAASGEPGIAGVALALTGNDWSGSPVSLTTTTDVNGNYSFTGLEPSDTNGYTVSESPVSGYYHEGQVVGGTGGVTGNRTITTVLDGGSDSTGNNFAEELPGTVSGYVYADANNNGLRQAGEGSIGVAVPVALTGTDDQGNAVSLSGSTDPTTGAYSFTNLRPGTYAVTLQSQPAGYVPGQETKGNVTSLGASSVGANLISGLTVGAGPVGDGERLRRARVGLSGRICVFRPERQRRQRLRRGRDRRRDAYVDGDERPGDDHSRHGNDRQRRLVPLRQPAAGNVQHRSDPTRRVPPRLRHDRDRRRQRRRQARDGHRRHDHERRPWAGQCRRRLRIRRDRTHVDLRIRVRRR